MELYRNPHIEIINEKYPDFFIEFVKSKGYKINSNQDKIRTLIDWNALDNKFTTPYFIENYRELIKNGLINSAFGKQNSKVLVEFGPNEPMIKTTSKYFIENWDDFILDYGTLGTTLITEDGNLLMEFTDDTYYLLYSNFPIKVEK